MAEKKTAYVTKMTPKGPAVWPKLDEPDYGTKTYPDPDGSYTTRMRWREKDPAFQKFRAEMDAYLETAVANGQAKFDAMPRQAREKVKQITINSVFTTIYDKQTDEPTGDVEMKISMKASGIVKKDGPRKGKKWTAAPDIFDGRGTKIKKCPKVFSGSEIRVSFDFDPEGYFIPGTGACGISVRMKAVQILRLANGAERSAADYGFGADEDGYSYDPSQEEELEEDGDINDDIPPAGDPAGSGDF